MSCSSTLSLDRSGFTYVDYVRRRKYSACVDSQRSPNAFPGWVFSEKAERIYDRSISSFLRIQKG